MENIGLKVPQSAIAHNMDDVRRIGSSMPFPMIIRPAFTLGGTAAASPTIWKTLRKSRVTA